MYFGSKMFQGRMDASLKLGNAMKISIRMRGLKSKPSVSQSYPAFPRRAKIGSRRYPCATRAIYPISYLKLRSRLQILLGKRNPTSPKLSLAPNALMIIPKFRGYGIDTSKNIGSHGWKRITTGKVSIRFIQSSFLSIRSNSGLVKNMNSFLRLAC